MFVLATYFCIFYFFNIHTALCATLKVRASLRTSPALDVRALGIPLPAKPQIIMNIVLFLLWFQGNKCRCCE